MLDRFRLDCGRYPTTNEGVEALLVAPPALQDRWQGPYVNPAHGRVLDAWGRPYDYVSEQKSHFRLRSLGADGKEAGIGEDADTGIEE